MTDAESFEEGYLDRLAGNVNRDRIESEQPGAAAYRAGVRTCQADLMAMNSVHDELTDHSGVPRASDYMIPAWERRLAEFWAKSHPPTPAKTVAEWAGEQSDKPAAAYNHEPSPWTKTVIDEITSGATPSAFAEPDPSSKKPRKAKPADEGQGSLFG